MFRISNIPIVGKIGFILAAFAIVSFAALGYAAVGMRSIDAAHRHAQDHQGVLAIKAARSAKNFNQVRAAIGDLLISTTDVGNQKALDEIKGSRARFERFMAEAEAAEPTRAAEVKALGASALRVIDVVCDKT